MQNEIKAGELRIGNYIYDDFNEIHVVEHIESQRFNDWNGSDPSLVVFSKLDKNDKGMYSCDVVTGIPLTPEILEKVGFERGKELTDRNVFYLYRFQYVLDGRFAVKKNSELVILNSDILYLHQLQNLYFALTNEELNIEL